jgi:putative ATPase
MQVAISAWDCFTRVGLRKASAQSAIVYLACAPKSNAVYTAFKAAMADARERPDYDVPVHLRNAPTKLMKEMGYGQEYRYAHDEPNAYAAGEEYFRRRWHKPAIITPQTEVLKARLAKSSPGSPDRIKIAL